MKKKLILYKSECKNPYLNLAFESWLLESKCRADCCILLTFSDVPCVVFGNFQNPWLECRLKEMENEHVLPVRRFSGGGAVYHDLGNLNLSFLRLERDHHKEENAEFVKDFLSKLGLPVFVNARSDLRIKSEKDVCDRKISGSAFKQKKDRSYHHMTLLCESNLDHLNFYLHSGLQDLIESKSIQSVRSKVANLSEYNKEITPSFIQEKLSDIASEVITVDEKYMRGIPEVLELSEEMQTWDFIYGKTPRMDLSFKKDSEEYRLTITKGLVVDFEVVGSDVHPSLLSELKEALLGQKFDQNILAIVEEKSEGVYSNELSHFKKYLRQFV